MSGNSYRKRLIDGKMKEYLETFGAICLEGPKWCGKTWTCEHFAASVFGVADPSGNFQNRRLAEMGPAAVLAGEHPRLIDEWQDVPGIWDAVRFAVDKAKEPGRFLLSGSSTPKRKGVYHSGAGRIARLRMRTLSLFETGDSSGVVSLGTLPDHPPKTVLTGEPSLADLALYVIRGGWPTQFRLKNRHKATVYAKEYLNALISDDMNRLEDRRRDPQKMSRLLRSLARNESTTASAKCLKKDMESTDGAGLDEDTIADYMGALERMFVIENQPPFAANIRSGARIKQLPKRHLTDPSIAAALLGATEKSLIGDLKTFGFLFEALCERDLSIYAASIGAKLYHYQDYKNREIDAVVAFADGRWGAFEIKLGANQIDAAAENLLKIEKSIREASAASAPAFLCVLCGLSNAAYTRPDGVYVVPLTALRD